MKGLAKTKDTILKQIRITSKLKIPFYVITMKLTTSVYYINI